MKLLKRNSNLELLRILSIVLIIFHHYAWYGIYIHDDSERDASKYIVTFLEMGGKYGVGIFILISGYYLWNSVFTTKRIMKVYVETYYYSLLGLLIFSQVVEERLQIKDIVNSIFPFTYEKYWFSTTYIILLFFSPFLNILIKSINKKQYEMLLVILVVIYSIIKTIFATDLTSSNITGFGMCYLIGAYISKYKEYFNEKAYVYLIYSIGSYVLLYFILLFFKLELVEFIDNEKYFGYFMQQTSFLIIFSSTCLVLWAVRVKTFYNLKINKFSSSIFSIYLIHDNDLFREILWRDILKTPQFQVGWTIYVHAIFSVCIVIIFSYLLNYISKRIILDKIIEYLNKFCEEMDKKY